MWALYAVGIPYIWYTLTRWQTPSGHGLNWKEPSGYNVTGIGKPSYGGYRFDRHVNDTEWHPDDILRASTTSELPYGEPYHVPFSHREKGVAGECP
jgi:hypothetical protein